MTRRIVLDYYRIDLADYAWDDPQERARLALIEASQRARLWVVPCEWSVIDDNGQTVTVVRRRFSTRPGV